MTLAHRFEAVLVEDGKLSLDSLPFHAGQTVEVIVLPIDHPTVPRVDLRGSVLRYDHPFDPVAEGDWGALQ